MIPRPKRGDKVVLAQVAEKLWPKVEKWLKEGDDLDDLEDSKAALVKTVTRSFYLDGYSLARDLDNWSPDAALVEILDQAGMFESSAKDQLVADWVVANGIQPKLAIGAAVKFRKGSDVTGEITAIDSRRATYTIFVARLGHVKEGVGTHGLVETFEEIEALNP